MTFWLSRLSLGADFVGMSLESSFSDDTVIARGDAANISSSHAFVLPDLQPHFLTDLHSMKSDLMNARLASASAQSKIRISPRL